MTKTVTGIFTSRVSAESAIRQLESAGVTHNQISLLMTDESRASRFKFIESTKADEGAAAGAGVGGLLGTIAGGLLSAGVLAIPGLNLVVTGALVSALAGLGAGAITGGLVGGLIGAGIPEHEAKMFEKEIQAGNVLVAVECDDSDEEKVVEAIFRNVDAYRSAA
jgi:hypothetical protein